VQEYGIHHVCLPAKIDGVGKSPTIMPFREKREIFQLQHAKKIKFLPAVEMTASVSTASYGFIYTL
jgi:hypothetical protein